jgi:hypothetical protein
MALGDGIRRNIAHVEPSERAALKAAIIEMHSNPVYRYPGGRADTPPGGVSWWFKQDEIHKATHVHGGPEFIPWHRELVNRFEGLLRQINPQLSIHYWDWTQDPRAIPNANLGGGQIGTLNLFTPEFMGYGGTTVEVIGPPWQNAAAPWRNDGCYIPAVVPDRDSFGNPADPPRAVNRSVVGGPASAADDTAILDAVDYAAMRGALEPVHDSMHNFVRMGNSHISFRDPFVFLLHANVDRLFARWQTEPAHPERLAPATVYGSESNLNVVVFGHTQNVNHNIEPWSGVPPIVRPWALPENQQVAKNYKDPSVVNPPNYDTNHPPLHWHWLNMGKPPGVNLRATMGAVTVKDTPNGPERPHVFAEGNDFNLWCRWSDGANWHWLNMGKPPGVNLRAMMGAVTVQDTPSGPERPHVFVEGNDFNLWCRWSDGANWHWLNMGKPPGVNLRATMGAVTVKDTPSGPERPHVFAEGNDFNLWCRWSDGANWHWLNMGKPPGVNLRAMMGAVTVQDTPSGAKRPHVFVEGSDFNLWCRWSDGADWYWTNMGKPSGVNLRAMMGAVTSRDPPSAPQRPHVFVEGNDFNLWCDWSDGVGL